MQPVKHTLRCIALVGGPSWFFHWRTYGKKMFTYMTGPSLCTVVAWVVDYSVQIMTMTSFFKIMLE